MFSEKASDLHLSSGNPPILRINGELTRVDAPALQDDQLKVMLYEIAPEYKIKTFEETGDVDFGYEITGVSRFRANFFTQKNGIAAVFRQIPSTVLSFEDFEKVGAPLPAVLKKFAMLHKGLVVVTGAGGSGDDHQALVQHAELFQHRGQRRAHFFKVLEREHRAGNLAEDGGDAVFLGEEIGAKTRDAGDFIAEVNVAGFLEGFDLVLRGDFVEHDLEHVVLQRGGVHARQFAVDAEDGRVAGGEVQVGGFLAEH